MKLTEKLLDLLYPPRCAFCRRLLWRDALMCPECAKSLPYTGAAARYGKIAHIAGCVSPLYYEEDVRASLLRYKFHSLTAYSKVYSKIIVKCIDECQISCDIITWVSLSAKRLRKRGYDQARLLAEEIAREKNIPCVRLLKKTVNNPAQSGTGSPEKRKANVAGVYAYAPDRPLDGKSVLLIDDIVTTGATLSECARVLKAEGAGPVYAATLARTRE